MVRFEYTSRVTVAPRSVQLDAHQRRRIVMVGVASTGGFVAAFAVTQFVGFYVFGDNTLLNPFAAVESVLVNLALAVSAAAFVIVNRWTERNRPRRAERVYFASVHSAVCVVMAVWVAHIHLAGTQNTIVAALIPFTAVVVMWVLNRFWAWFYWALGSLAMFTISAFEIMGHLAYFPLATRGAELVDLFHDIRFLFMNGILYMVCSVLPLAFVTRLHRELDARTRELEETRAELEILASTDSLTGLHIRRAVLPRLGEEIARVDREGHPLALVILDIDNFKSVNDTHGHAMGDAVLQSTADVLRASLRPYDMVARIGGEEFMVVLPGDDLAGGSALAERIRLMLAAKNVSLNGVTLSVTASFGVACRRPGESTGVDDLMHRADEAHYKAKRSGKNRVCLEDRAQSDERKIG